MSQDSNTNNSQSEDVLRENLLSLGLDVIDGSSRVFMNGYEV